MGPKDSHHRGRYPSQLEVLRSENGALRIENAELLRENARLVKCVDELQKAVAELREKLGINSQNSSLPPSADRPDAPARPPQQSSKRKPGGQPGHPRHQRSAAAQNGVTGHRVHKPRECRVCHTVLLGDDPHPEIVQQTELPDPRPLVTEHELHSLCCLNCGAVTKAHLPAEIARGPFGVRLQATVALYSSDYRLSDRKVQAALSDLHGVSMSIGSVATCRQNVSASLARCVDEAQQYARQQPVKYADETGWKEGIKRLKAWVWLLCTPLVTVFLIQPSRATAAAQRLLGKTFGVLVTDRLGSYNWWPIEWRQMCWAHLKRDFQKILERGGESARIGAALLVEQRQLFRWWHRVRDGTLSRHTFRRYVAPLRLRVRRLLEQGEACPHSKTAGTCEELLKVERSLWTFVSKEGVEPTNNTSERSGRPAVIKRKLSFGTHSAAGSRFVERMLTVSTTLRQQSRPVLDFLVSAFQASIEGRLAPSLLPHRQA